MIKKDLNLQPLQAFLTKDVDINYLVGELDKALLSFYPYGYGVSEQKNEPIYNDTLAGAYWIAQLKDIFSEIK